MAINHGLYHDMLTTAEEQLGLPPKSALPLNNITEYDLIPVVAQVRHERLYAIAEKYNFGGLKVPRRLLDRDYRRRGLVASR